VRAGQAFMSDVVHAFMDSPQWSRGALFVVYDEWGGFFDHVPCPRVPDDRSNQDINKDYGLMGFRIPAIAVSPYVRRRHVEHSTYGFESILKMIEYRFGMRPLTSRDWLTNNIAHSFDWRSKPQLVPPDLPRPPEVVSVACATQGSVSGNATDGAAAPTRPKEHDLMALVASGYLDRLGFEFRRATVDGMYREPSKLVGAFTAAG
jgi:phospholipase C